MGLFSPTCWGFGGLGAAARVGAGPPRPAAQTVLSIFVVQLHRVGYLVPRILVPLAISVGLLAAAASVADVSPAAPVLSEWPC